MLPQYKDSTYTQPRSTWQQIKRWFSRYSIDAIGITILFGMFAVCTYFIVQSIVHCPNCNEDCSSSDNYCSNCGYMLRPVSN